MNRKEALRKKAKGKKGFTLVELVIVIAVLAIIAAIAIPTVTNVIGDANAAADASNAQSIEMAIKTAQAECAANATNHSARADKIITGDRSLGALISIYGVSTDVITKPKVSGDKFFYNPTSGKVIARVAKTVKDFAAISDTTSFTSKDAGGTTDVTTSPIDKPNSAVIALTVTADTADS